MKQTRYEEEALEAVSIPSLIDFLERLVAVPSMAEADERHLAGQQETAAQELMKSEMERIGLSTDFWTIDLEELEKHPSYSVEIERSKAMGLVGTLCGRNEGSLSRSLILNGHVDVVPAGDPSRWTGPAFEARRSEGAIFGRGALDMKGGLCCGLFALDAIRKARIPLLGEVHLESVVGEEDGGLGSLATALRGYSADGAIIMEPTNLAITRAQAGCANFRLTVPGLSAHGCFRDEGVSAIEKFAYVHQQLLQFELDYNHHHPNPLYASLNKPYPLSIGTLSAGNWPSSVPDNLVAEGRYGVAADSNLEAGKSEFEQVLRRANQADPWLRDNPATVEWWGGQFEPASTRAEAEVVTTLESAFYDTTGSRAILDGATYGSDMRLLVHQAQTETVMFGPGDVRLAHAPDESVPIEHLETVTRTLIRTILRFCGTE